MSIINTSWNYEFVNDPINDIIGGNVFDNVVEDSSGIIDKFKEIWTNVRGIWDGLDFTVLYSWLPDDIENVITAVLSILLVLALFGLVRRLLFFLG